MSEKNEECAFPVPENSWQFGMSLRDYFAAKAMQGAYGSPREIAVESYKQADEMLAARQDLPEPDQSLVVAVRAFIDASGGVSIVTSDAAAAFDRMQRIAERAK